MGGGVYCGGNEEMFGHFLVVGGLSPPTPTLPTYPPVGKTLKGECEI